MAGRLLSLILGSLFLGGALHAQPAEPFPGEPPPPPPPEPPPFAVPPDDVVPRPPKGPKGDPENFHRNRKIWENLPEEERALLRRKAREMVERAKERVEEIIEEEGLELDREHRVKFFRRYFEERRKIESILRKKMHEERRLMENEAIKKIAAEFEGKRSTPEPE